MIDIHAHIWLGREREDAAALRDAARLYGIEKILVSALGSHRPDSGEIAALNRAAVELCQDSRFGGYVTIAPELPDAPQVLERGIQNGMVGMKIWVSCLCDERCCDPLYHRCGEAGVPVLVHTFAKSLGQLPGESTAVQLRNAALRHPKTNFIMAHLGGNCCHGIPMVEDLPNVYADFSGSGSRADDVGYALTHLGPERLLFGTDMPGSFVMSWGQLLGAGLNQREMALICRGNALRLFPGLEVSP